MHTKPETNPRLRLPSEQDSENVQKQKQNLAFIVLFFLTSIARDDGSRGERWRFAFIEYPVEN